MSINLHRTFKTSRQNAIEFENKHSCSEILNILKSQSMNLIEIGKVGTPIVSSKDRRTFDNEETRLAGAIEGIIIE